jgi:hypothetical protein
MTRFAVSVACVGAFCLGITLNASAEPITITAGSFEFPEIAIAQGAPISLTGTRGFSLQGFVDSGESTFGALCTPCTPDITLSVGADLFGSALLVSTATLDGQTYLDVNQFSSPVAIALTLAGSAHLPALQASPAMVIAPFTVTGTFSFLDIQGQLPPVEIPIRGAGNVTMTLTPAPQSWAAAPIRYDFTQPTPEPATLTLMSAGLIGATTRLRKRRAANASEANRRIRFVEVRRRQP